MSVTMKWAWWLGHVWHRVGVEEVGRASVLAWTGKCVMSTILKEPEGQHDVGVLTDTTGSHLSLCL